MGGLSGGLIEWGALIECRGLNRVGGLIEWARA